MLLRRKLCFRLIVISLTFSCTFGDSDENSGRLLTKAAKNLMTLAINDSGMSDEQIALNHYEVEQPKHEDLAISRLQDKVKETIDKLWTTITDPRRLINLREKTDKVTNFILQVFAQSLQSDIFSLENQVESSNGINALKQAKIEKSILGEKWKKDWKKLVKITRQIDILYDHFYRYMSDSLNASSTALEDFARSIVEPGSSKSSSLLSQLVELHNLTLPSLEAFIEPRISFDNKKRTDMFYVMHLILNGKGEDNLSEVGQSPHQLMFNLYNAIALAEIKGYAMIQFSYMMLKLYKRGNFTLESDLARKNFESQTAEKLLIVQSILPNMDRTIWRNDPFKHEEGKTFVRMTKLLQGIIENEVDMNGRNTCRGNCKAYTVAETKGRCYKDLFCAKQGERCDKGRLFDCTFFDADAWVCMSNDQERRYDWVEYEDRTILGYKNRCINKIKVDSWWKYLFWHCSYCLCKCDQPGPTSDRYWSLRPITSDIENNKIVTAVRFVKKDRVIQLEIEEAEALAEGGVNEGTRKWKTNPPIDIDTAEENRDYIQMSYEKRSIDLDDLEAPPGHIITGVKLRNLGGHVNLEIQITPIKFNDGQLVPERSTWLGNDNTPATANARSEIDILMPDISTNFRGKSQIQEYNNKYIQFDSTSAHRDVMQTTIPYIDSQEVKPSSGVWLSGIGLYYKGHLGYGGFVGLSVKTFDFSKHLIPGEKTSQLFKEEVIHKLKDTKKNIIKK